MSAIKDLIASGALDARDIALLKSVFRDSGLGDNQTFTVSASALRAQSADVSNTYLPQVDALIKAISLARTDNTNVFAKGAVGNGTADDTAAIQAALDLYSRSAAGAAGRTGALFLPDGIYRITSPLKYYGNATYGLKLFANNAAGGGTGAVLKWDGDVGETMLHCRGMCDSLIENICFNGNTAAGRLLWLEAFQLPTGTINAGSSGNVLRRLMFIDPRNHASASCLELGNEDDAPTTYQCDQLEAYDCQFNTTAGSAATAVKSVIGGNTKNHRFRGGVVAGFYNAFDWAKGAGSMSAQDITMADISNACFTIGSGATYRLESIEVENGTPLTTQAGRFIDNAVSSLPNQATVIGCQFFGGPSDDIVINFNGALILIGNQLHNWRTGSTKAKVIVGATNNRGVVSIGNQYRNSLAGEFAPIYDGSANNLLGVDASNGYAQSVELNVMSLNDFGGDTTSAAVQLKSALPGFTSVQLGQAQQIPAAVMQTCAGELRVGYNKIVVPKEVWTTAATSQVYEIGKIPAKARIRGTITDVTAAYANLAGTIQLRLGNDSDDDAYIKAHDVKAAAVCKGLLDADLGVALVAATAVQGGDVPSRTSNIGLKLTLVSGTGNIGTGAATNLTAGSVTVEFFLERH